jgi:hypothetical protein
VQILDMTKQLLSIIRSPVALWSPSCCCIWSRNELVNVRALPVWRLSMIFRESGIYFDPKRWLLRPGFVGMAVVSTLEILTVAWPSEWWNQR